MGVKELIQSETETAFSCLLTILQSDVLDAVNDSGDELYINVFLIFSLTATERALRELLWRIKAFCGKT